MDNIQSDEVSSTTPPHHPPLHHTFPLPILPIQESIISCTMFVHGNRVDEINYWIEKIEENYPNRFTLEQRVILANGWVEYLMDCQIHPFPPPLEDDHIIRDDDDDVDDEDIIIDEDEDDESDDESDDDVLVINLLN
jgi:hypothetical protein